VQSQTPRFSSEFMSETRKRSQIVGGLGLSRIDLGIQGGAQGGGFWGGFVWVGVWGMGICIRVCLSSFMK